jgi:hypothetical protein
MNPRDWIDGAQHELRDALYNVGRYLAAWDAETDRKSFNRYPIGSRMAQRIKRNIERTLVLFD